MEHSSSLIAVVEDEHSVRKAFGRLLCAAGYRTRTYATGEEFLRALPTDLPDCLLLDLHLPGLTGLEVQSRLREAGVALPVIFVTVEERREFREQALQSGALAWLQKPIPDQSLLDVIALAVPRPG